MSILIRPSIQVQKYHDQPVAVKQAFNALVPVFNALKRHDGTPIACWIAGGCIRDLILYGAHNTDIDVFFPNVGEIQDAKPLVLSVTKPGITSTVNQGVSKMIFESGFVYKYETPLGKIDLIRRNFSGPADTVASFDFTVCAAAFDRDGNFYHHERFFTDLQARKLVCLTLSHPLSTLRRLQKYVQKGFTICNGGVLQLAQAIQKCEDLSTQEVFYVD